LTNVRIPAGAVQLQHLHPKVTARAIGGITCVVQASAPASPNQGDLWVNPSNSCQLSQWSGAQWFAVPINAGSLTGENFMISAPGQFHYASPPAFNTWSFEAGLAGWTSANATLAPSNAQSNVGAYSALLTYTSGTSWSAASPQQAVQAGNQVYVSAWVLAPQALGAVGLQLAWYNSGGTPLSTSSDATAALAADTWAQLTFNAAPPAGAVFCEIVIQDAETSVTGYQLFIDDVFIAGQLAVAVAPSEGADTLGNGHPAGIYTAGVLGTGVTMSTGSPVEHAPGNTGVTAQGEGGPSVRLGTGLWSPTMTGSTAHQDLSAVLLFSSQQETAGTGGGILSYTTGAGEVSAPLTWGADGVQVNGGLSSTGTLSVGAGLSTPASALSGGVIISQVDNQFTSQGNPVTPSRICKVWPIPAGDPVTLTAYRLSMPFSGTWKGNPLSFQIAGLGEVLAAFTIGGALMTSGLGFGGELTACVIVSSTVSGEGILTGWIRANVWNAASNQLPGGGANGSGGFGGLSVVEGIAAIGAANSSMTVQASFGASNSGQSIEGFGSVFERIGGNA
jgi:hypothetical protein